MQYELQTTLMNMTVLMKSGASQNIHRKVNEWIPQKISI